MYILSVLILDVIVKIYYKKLCSSIFFGQSVKDIIIDAIPGLSLSAIKKTTFFLRFETILLILLLKYHCHI